MPPRILIVDDEPYMLELLETIIRENTPYQARGVSDPRRVPALLEGGSYDLVFLDLRMPGMDGMELLGRIKRQHPEVEVIMVTGYGTIAGAVEALQRGAADFITKPFPKKQLVMVLEKVIHLQELKRQNRDLRRALARKYDLGHFIGGGEGSRALGEEIGRLAATMVPVFLHGEFGTGRSFVAKALHYNGPRAGGPFLDLACAAVAREDLALLIFGRAEPEARPGLLAQARGGTLHLADLQALPRQVQKSLARFLAEGSFLPQGGGERMSAEVRLVLSSDQDLDQLQAQDLVDRELASHLAGFQLALPPLRSRREDIPRLVEGFLAKYREIYAKNVESISREALEWLMAHHWPGNIRELENTLERAVLMAAGPVIGLDDLRPADELSSFIFSLDATTLDLPRDQALDAATAQFQREFVRRHLLHHLSRNRGDLAAAARSLGMEQNELVQEMDRLHISPALSGPGSGQPA